MTGSGKTVLAQSFLSRRKWVVVIDMKHELGTGANPWPGFKVVSGLAPIENLAAPHLIVRPYTVSQVNDVLELVYRQRGWDVFIDEVYGISHNGSVSSYPPAFTALLTRGRSRGVTVWSGLQRPRFAPKFIFTESTHFFIFRLAHADDRKTVADFTMPEMKDFRPERYAFAYYNRLRHEVAYSQPLRKDLIP